MLSEESKQKISTTLKQKYLKGEIIHWLKGNKGYTNKGSFKKGHIINLNKKMESNIKKMDINNFKEVLNDNL